MGCVNKLRYIKGGPLCRNSKVLSSCTSFSSPRATWLPRHVVPPVRAHGDAGSSQGCRPCLQLEGSGKGSQFDGFTMISFKKLSLFKNNINRTYTEIYLFWSPKVVHITNVFPACCIRAVRSSWSHRCFHPLGWSSNIGALDFRCTWATGPKSRRLVFFNPT